jgi:prepilin-type N-terminal cleavage/methylation domain-containing protein
MIARIMQTVTDARTDSDMRTSHKSAFTLLEIMIVVSLIGLLAAIAIPNLVRANSQSKKSACINNLVEIRNATAQWALENCRASGCPVEFSDIKGYLRNAVVCPAGGTSFSDSYTTSDTTSLPVCKRVPAGPEAHIMPPDTTQ